MTHRPAASAATHVDAAAIAAALGIEKRSVERRAIAGSWPYVEEPQRGGHKRLYAIATLPQTAQDALADRATAQALQHLPSPPALVLPAPPNPAEALPGRPQPSGSRALRIPATAPEDSTTEQRQRALSRQIVLRALAGVQASRRCTTRAAALLLLAEAAAGRITPALLMHLQQACDPRGGGLDGVGATTPATTPASALPSAGTLQRWARQQRDGHSLVPRASAVASVAVRGWYAPYFALTDRPQKPTLKAAYEQLLGAWQPEWADAPGAPPPSYDACVRAHAKRSKIDALKARHTGSALRSRSFYHHRTYADMAPWDEVHSDGWTTHFTAPDPVTGAFRTFEVWHFHDVATRYVPPMAIGKSEKTDVILDGLQRAIRAGGVMAIWQTDHTSSVKNKRVMDEHSGLADRLGISVVHPAEVGNSQANGMAENFNTWLDREARALATYQHPQRMDSATFVRVRRITNAMVRAAGNPVERAGLRRQAMQLGKGIVFDSYADAEAWLRGLEAKWNNHPHSALPKVRDPATGRLVHMTPQQSLDAARAAGWQPLTLPEGVLVDQFRPHLAKKVTRGTVSPYGGMRYHHPALAHHEGEDVLVAVDQDRPECVWVKDLQGRLIAQASFVEAVGPRTQSMREHADGKRAAARVRNLENKIDAIAAEQAAPLVLDMAAPGLDLAGINPGVVTGVVARVAEPVAASDPAEDSTDPMEIYLRAQIERNRIAAAQERLDGLAHIEAAMKKAAQEAADQEADDNDFEEATGG